MNDSLLHRIISELLEDASPEKMERLDQAINDVKVDIANKSQRIREIQSRMEDIDSMLNGINGSQDPKMLLLHKALRTRRGNLEKEAEGINLGKMVKRLNSLKDEKEELEWNNAIVEDLKGVINGDRG